MNYLQIRSAEGFQQPMAKFFRSHGNKESGYVLVLNFTNCLNLDAKTSHGICESSGELLYQLTVFILSLFCISRSCPHTQSAPAAPHFGRSSPLLEKLVHG
jgi:hypothetical protein